MRIEYRSYGPVEVEKCPACGCKKARVVGCAYLEPEKIELGGRVHPTTNAVRLIGWIMACGCLLPGERFTLVYMPEEVPYFIDNEAQPTLEVSDSRKREGGTP